MACVVYEMSYVVVRRTYVRSICEVDRCSKARLRPAKTRGNQLLPVPRHATSARCPLHIRQSDANGHRWISRATKGRARGRGRGLTAPGWVTSAAVRV